MKKLKLILAEYGSQISLFVPIIIISVVFGILSPYFFSFINFRNIMLYMSINGIMSLGATITMLHGNFDIAQFSTAAFSGVISTLLIMNRGWNSGTVIFIILGVGLIVGLLNGFIVTKMGITPLIATMATSLIIRSLCYIFSEGRTLLFQDKMFNRMGTGFTMGLPNSMWFMVIAFIIIQFILVKTRYGRNTYAVGANKTASFLAGISVSGTQIIGYVISAVSAAYAGILMTAQVGAIVPTSGVGQEMEVIAAVVLGGLSLSGGEGKLIGTVLGTLILTIITNGLTLLSVQSYYQLLAKGTILIIAVYIDTMRKSMKSRKVK
jgi:ribose transport system permease protein